MTKPNLPRIRLLIDALRSGNFKQGTGSLESWEINEDGRVNPRNCCLGVACRVALQNGLDLDVSIWSATPEITMFDGEVGYLPSSVVDWYGFSNMNPALKTPDLEFSLMCASTLNDSQQKNFNDSRQKNFDEIAHYFELTYFPESL